MLKLASSNLWSTIESLSANASSKIAAVAYVSDDSYIRFGKGDTLIVDASDEAIKMGQTSAEVLSDAYNRGVKLYSCTALHSKLMVFDDFTIIGSANISRSSHTRLQEIGIISDNAEINQEALQVVDKLKKRSERVGKAFLKRILALEVTTNPSGRNSHWGTKPTLLQAICRRDELLDDFVFSLYETNTTLTASRIRQEARAQNVKLPPKDRWVWYEEEYSAKLASFYDKVFSKKGMKTLSLEVETDNEGRIVKVKSLDAVMQIYVNHFRVGKKLMVINYLSDSHPPFSLKGQDARILCKKIVRAISEDQRLGKRLAGKMGWIITTSEIANLLDGTE